MATIFISGLALTSPDLNNVNSSLSFIQWPGARFSKILKLSGVTDFDNHFACSCLEDVLQDQKFDKINCFLGPKMLSGVRTFEKQTPDI